ncbi:MAG: phosphopantetheine-binding protein [Clostridia bacterium]
MDKSLIRNNIIQALAKVFIFVDSAENEDVDLETYIDDSIQFMSFIVELEQIFNIEFPPELLLFDNFKTINNISLIIEEMSALDA